MYQDRFAFHVKVPKVLDVHGPSGLGADHYAFEVCNRVHRQLRQVLAIGVSVKGRIQIGPGVRNQFDAANIKLGSFGVMRFGFFTTEEIANDWRRKTAIGNHPMLDRMADVD
jgi:hypothetical protein